MKSFKTLVITCSAIFMSIASLVSAQSRTEKEANVQKLLDSKTFTFIADSALPMTGSNIRLTSSYYQISFHKDSLNSFLPYFGVAFRLQYGATRSPLIFSSDDFSYQATTTKKGGRVLTIKINSPDDPDTLTLSVSPSGYSTLQVNSINRQPISFYGIITSNAKTAI